MGQTIFFIHIFFTLLFFACSAQQKQQQLKEQQKDEEKKKRIEESNKAYDEWREKSKIKPKPATQGLLR